MSEFVQARPITDRYAAWLEPLAILLVAAVMRLAFFRGAQGSDELVYMTQGHQLLHGIIEHSTYIGSLRFGINLASALSLGLFGNGLVGADALFFLCSLGEVWLAYSLAGHLWGRRAAVWAALALAVLPLDVALAGSLNPDCYLALTIAGSVVIFHHAQRTDRTLLYVAAGLLTGWVYWVKEAVVIYAAVFPCLVLACDGLKWRRGYWWFVFSIVFVIALNLGVFYAVYGNPFYDLQILRKKAAYVQFDIGAHPSLWYYLDLLFIKCYHTGLLGWLALAGAVSSWRLRDPGLRFVLVWGGVLLVMFSAFPISFSPLEFIDKQPNYMEIFLFPLVLLAGWFLSRQSLAVTTLLGGAMLVSGLLLSALEQQVIRIASVNGEAAAAFADSHPGVPVFGPPSVQRQSLLQEILRGNYTSSGIRPYAALMTLPVGAGPQDTIVAYAIDDPQMNLLPFWRHFYKTDRMSEGLRSCLIPVETLTPGNFGFGRNIVAALRTGSSLLPAALSLRVLESTNSVWQISPARAYAVTRGCLIQARDH